MKKIKTRFYSPRINRNILQLLVRSQVSTGSQNQGHWHTVPALEPLSYWDLIYILTDRLTPSDIFQDHKAEQNQDKNLRPAVFNSLFIYLLHIIIYYNILCFINKLPIAKYNTEIFYFQAMTTAVLKQLQSVLKSYMLKHRPGYGVIILACIWSTHLISISLLQTYCGKVSLRLIMNLISTKPTSLVSMEYFLAYWFHQPFCPETLNTAAYHPPNSKLSSQKQVLGVPHL